VHAPDAPEPDPHTYELRRVVWKVAGAVWKRLEYDWDADGRRTTTRVYGATGTLTQTEDREYDAAGRLTEIKVNGIVYATWAYTHGFLTETTLGNGNRVLRGYDAKGRLAQLDHVNALGSCLASVAYTYDTRDRRKTATWSHLGVVSEFEYTDNSWLRREKHTFGDTGPTYDNEEHLETGANESSDSAVVPATPALPGGSGVDLDVTYTYDDRGNRTGKDVAGGSAGDASYVYDDEDKLLSEDRGGVPVSWTYGLRGDMKTMTIGGTLRSFTTDHIGRIVGASTPTAEWVYRFAPTGDRIAKTNAMAAEENEWQLPDGGDTIADYVKTSGGGETQTGFYVSPGVDGRVARIGEGGAVTYTFGDALQSVHQVTNAAGAVVRTQFTDAWGNDLDVGLPKTATGAGDRYGFTGRENDAESGLMHYRARSYDPVVGRFTSRDPVWHANLYFYADNDPSNAIDPAGTKTIVLHDENAIRVKVKAELYSREEAMSHAKLKALAKTWTAELTRRWNTPGFRVFAWKNAERTGRGQFKEVSFEFELIAADPAQEPTGGHVAELGAKEAHQVEIVSAAVRAHAEIPPAGGGRGVNVARIGVNDSAKTVAHEFGHMMGLLDEYVEHVSPTEDEARKVLAGHPETIATNGHTISKLAATTFDAADGVHSITVYGDGVMGGGEEIMPHYIDRILQHNDAVAHAMDKAVQK